MREIKFRTWHKQTNEMSMVMGLAVSDLSERFDLVDDSTLGELMVSDWDVLDNRVLMQYTGLKDKNGMEIYEGDIVTAREKSSMAPFTGYVHYLNAQYWVNYIAYESYYIPLIQLHGAEYKPIEVIGNIYENPELLEVQA